VNKLFGSANFRDGALRPRMCAELQMRKVETRPNEASFQTRAVPIPKGSALRLHARGALCKHYSIPQGLKPLFYGDL